MCSIVGGVIFTPWFQMEKHSPQVEAGALSKAGFGYAITAFPHDGNGNHLIAEMKDVISKYVKEGIPTDLV